MQPGRIVDSFQKGAAMKAAYQIADRKDSGALARLEDGAMALR